MKLTNKQRSERCGKMIATYSDDDPRTNLIDWLADAMHWCNCNDDDFADVLDTAQIHFDVEISEAAQSGGRHD